MVGTCNECKATVNVCTDPSVKLILSGYWIRICWVCQCSSKVGIDLICVGPNKKRKED